MSVATGCVPDEDVPVDGAITFELPSSVQLVDIPAGTFTMGGTTMQNDAPEVSVSLSAFRISATEITNAQYLQFLNAAISEGWVKAEEQTVADPCGQNKEYVVIGTGAAPHAGQIYMQLGETGGCTSKGEAEHINNKSWIKYNSANNQFELIDQSKGNWPVNWIKWYGADAFAQFYGASLPTEAQWEYAAAGNKQFDYPTDDGSISDSKANYNGDTPGVHDPNGHVKAVKQYPANPFGLYDMAGNVWEWCADYYSASFYKTGTTDPINTQAGAESKRVRRGGSWNYHSATLLCHARASDLESRGNNHFGFRVVSK